MRLLSTTLLLLALLSPMVFPAPARALEQAVLQEILKEEKVDFTRLSIGFSSLPTFRLDSLGQRLDIHLKGTKVDPRLRRIPEDDVVLKVMIAQRQEDCVLSFLLRRIPIRVQTTAERDKVRLSVDLYWGSAGPRPAIDMRSLPFRGLPGKSLPTSQKSRYAGNWKNFFRDYRTPLDLRIPMRFTMPGLPPLPEERLSGKGRSVHDLIRAGEWQALKDLGRELGSVPSQDPETELLQTLYLEYLARSGAAEEIPAAWPDRVKEPCLASRYAYLRHFLEARIQPYVARFGLLDELGGMAPADPLRPYYQLLLAEIALSLGDLEELSRRLLDPDTAWPEALQELRSLRLVDGGVSLPEPATATAPAVSGPEPAVSQEPSEQPANPVSAPKPETAAEDLFLTVEVRRGDSWWRLARRHDTTVAALKKANGAKDDLLLPGQKIRLPRAVAVAALPPVEDAPAGPSPRPATEPPPPQPAAPPSVAAPPRVSPYNRFLGESGILFRHPFSLGRAALSFREAGDRAQALALFRKLRPLLEDPEAIRLTRFAEADLLVEMGRLKEGITALELLADEAPDSEGGCRARLLLLDLQLQDWGSGDLLFRAFQYGQVEELTLVRGLKEEASFKRALVLHMGGKKREAIEALRSFRKKFATSPLVAEAGAFLAEVLPPYLEELMTAQRDFDVTLVLDQNREFLLAGDLGKDFLFRLAGSLSRLELSERASRIFLYLLDIYRDRPEEEEVYLPLVRAYFERGEYAAVQDFAGRYLKRFPAGRDRDGVFLLRMKAMQRSGNLDGAIDSWRTAPRPVAGEASLLAARLFHERGDRRGVLEAFAALPAAGEPLPPAFSYIQAEALFQTGDHNAACPLFRELRADPDYGDGALYRLGQISIRRGRREEALNYFRRLAEKEREGGLWKRLAVESIRDLELNR
ncbi:MAG: LysM peptidoglycan-binding domain-containing protein [Deltaproteobacteria bacterium]|nr:LysM peptidoglycan-binding domain-containing protein [Deltaproteobacteria bacterium]